MAIHNIGIPKLGMMMKQATLVEWKAKEGEKIEKGSLVLAIEAEKTGFEIQAESSGFLHILVEEGSEVPVLRVVGMIAETKEELESLQKEPPKEIYTTMPEAKEPPRAEEITGVVGTVATATRADGERIAISPLARKMAQEHKLDITKIVGTGPEGRITKDDIEREIEAKKKETPKVPTEVHLGKRIKSTIPLKGMRKTIAEHMHRSLSVSAQVTTIAEFEVTELVKLRENLLRQEKTIGTRITYTEILVFIITKALKDHPLINSSLIDNEIKIWEDINIGVAVGLGEKGDKGLIVPVIKNADQKSLVELSKMIKSLAEKAQAGKLLPDDVTGGTFTLTSLGGRGVGLYQTPIINQPEAAILGVGRIRDRAVVKDGQIVIAPMMPCSITVDHRIIDGVIVENFLGRLQELIENPDLLLL
jgi:pyruvate dehydrogenase E2 component (dihydrolipoamide acetyltransferase)/2-oxoglutarate dehydrogenase E2 component (dihydrolipoamide succinyltransferase)